ncbi:geranylgeranyl pyrophosphate synthase [Crossiella equi]|uniref:Geranylgeranyl pyrophosphate synthase n=1 Tax=Crossiella equi TaxID=130796 RepID=A0ABS5APJ7_9PSEU|nr:polyprenyl synthetase family protein [Crossiella equi]MBP2478489.1 geranylgeranyl pyrophosphate synthase [Crossiella equi]
MTGDLFLIVATQMLAAEDVAAARILTRALRALCQGQNADLSFERRQRVSLRECPHMVEGKAAAPLGASCELGARAGGACAEPLALAELINRRDR